MLVDEDAIRSYKIPIFLGHWQFLVSHGVPVSRPHGSSRAGGPGSAASGTELVRSQSSSHDVCVVPSGERLHSNGKIHPFEWENPLIRLGHVQ